MTTWIEVTPAYGRDYTTQSAVKADWRADMDFRDTATGRYVNRSDAKNLGLSVIVRYAKNQKVVAV